MWHYTVTGGQSGGISHLNVEAIDHDGVVVVAINGDIDITNVDKARAAVEAQMHTHPGGIVVHLAVGFFASTGLSMLAEANQRARQAGIGFAVVVTKDVTRRALVVTGMDQVLLLHETVPHAIEALLAASTAKRPDPVT